MPSLNRRVVMFAVAVAGASLVEGCVMTTGQFVPSKAAPVSRSMVSRYDVLHQQSTPANAPRATMRVTHEQPTTGYRYY